MALKAGRRGLNKRLVDAFGNLNGEAPSGDYYTKQQTDNKFATKTHVNNTFQKKTLEVPLEMLSGSKLTVEDALQGLNEEKFTYADNGVLGAKNLLPLTLYGIKALNSSRTWNGNSCEHNGITFTVNVDDKGNVTSVSESGTATGFAFLRLANVASFSGSYILSKGISVSKIVYIQNETTGVEIVESTGGDILVNLTPTNDVVNCIMGVKQGQTGDGTFYPMLRLASDPDDTYVPYAMTNRELTENKVDKSAIELNNADLNNITETGFYYIRGGCTNVPDNIAYLGLKVQKNSASNIHQMVLGASVIYTRIKTGSPATWSPWYKFTGTELS